MDSGIINNTKGDRPERPRTFLRQKAGLLLLGLFLFLLLLEVGLRLGGFILLSMQEYRNRQAIKQNGAYRIMCLGESTTQRQYPDFLEEELNRSNTGIRFSVIDNGLGGATTPVILARLESDLDKYHPDMVVTMMGINDKGKHLPYEADSVSKGVLLFRSLKSYKLARLIWLHILAKTNEPQTYLPVSGLKEACTELTLAEDSLKKAVELKPQNSQAYLELGRFYRDQGKFPQAESSFKKAIELNPRNYGAYLESKWFYQEQMSSSQAEDIYKEAIELNPMDYSAYFALGRLYYNQDKLPQAEESFNKAIGLNPNIGGVYLELGRLYRDRGKLLQAENSFKKAIELNPKNDSAYFELGWLYQKQERFNESEDIYKRVIELNPKNDEAYLRLGWFYRDQGEFSLAEDVFKRALGLNPKSQDVYRALSVLYEELGKPDLAKEYINEAVKVRLESYNPQTVNNYRRLKEILDTRRISLVCAQYPMRNIAPLKRIFEGNSDSVIFVDNEKVFKDAVKKNGFRTYFRDVFGGDFGHCTPVGNRLLAETISAAILKKAFRD